MAATGRQPDKFIVESEHHSGGNFAAPGLSEEIFPNITFRNDLYDGGSDHWEVCNGKAVILAKC